MPRIKNKLPLPAAGLAAQGLSPGRGAPAQEGHEHLGARAAGVADQHAQRRLAQAAPHRALRHLHVHHARAPQAHMPGMAAQSRWTPCILL